jgi:hypothetical protein
MDKMKNEFSFLEGLFLLMVSLSLAVKTMATEKITITTSSPAAQVYVNGVAIGKGEVEIKIDRKDRITVEVRPEGQQQP